MIQFIRWKSIIFEGKIFSDELMKFEILNFSAFIKQNYISDSPFIFLIAPNHIKTVIAYFAIIEIGKIVVFVDPNIGTFEFDEMKNKTPPGAIIKPVQTQMCWSYNEEVMFCKSENEYNQHELTDVCTIAYTAADDGYSKPAMLTRKSLLADARSLANVNNTDSNSIVCSLIPLHHLYALVTGILASGISGTSVLLQDVENFGNLKKYAEEFIKYGVTHLYSIPAMYYLLAKLPDIKKFTEKNVCLSSGGYKLPCSLHDFYREKFGVLIFEGYGLTEASPMCTWHRPSDGIRLSSVGRALPCCSILIKDNQNQIVPIGEIGEVCIRGDNVMNGYYNCRDATAQTIRSGLLYSGDLGMLDGEGFLYLKGLKKRMLNVGGLKVYNAEVERLIRLNDNVRHVDVFGQPVEILGDRVGAHIGLKNDGEIERKAFMIWCRQNISKYKIPKAIEFCNAD